MNDFVRCSPFGGIPRNWKPHLRGFNFGRQVAQFQVPPSGGSLEIGNYKQTGSGCFQDGQFPLRGDP